MSGSYETREGVEFPTFDVTSLGGGLKLTNRTHGPLTIAKADEILNMHEFVGDRKLKSWHVDALVKRMKQGTFLVEQVQIITCYCHETTTDYRMNGQHTCWARKEMPATWDCRVAFLRYEADTMEDVRRLYASIDRGSPRTRRNVIDSYLSGTEEFGCYNAWSVRQCATGLSYAKWVGRDRRAIDPDDIAYLMLTEHLDTCHTICTLLDSCGNWSANNPNIFMFNASVSAAMFLILDAGATKKNFAEFWHAVRDGVGMESSTDPRLKLRNSLVAARGARAHHEAGSIAAANTEYMIDNCLRAWNCWRTGEPVARMAALGKWTDKNSRRTVKP